MQHPIEIQRPPFSFMPLLAQSLVLYKAHFANLMLLGLFSFAPFWLLDKLAPGLDLHDLVELFHGHMLDLLVFLALPTIFASKRIYPLATMKIFQDYFATAVVLVLFQIFALFFSMLFFSQFGLMFVTFGLVPFVFVLFIGQFLLVNGTPKFSGLKQGVVDSVSLVRAHFLPVFFGYINVSILMIVPIFLFSVFYLKGHPEMAALVESSANPENPLEMNGIVEMMQGIVAEMEYQAGRMGIHLLLRPLKSIFMALLFASLLEVAFPEKHRAFFGTSEETPVDSEE